MRKEVTQISKKKSIPTHADTIESFSNVLVKLLRILAILPFENRTLNFFGSHVLFFYFHASNMFYNTMYVGGAARSIYQGNFDIEYFCEFVMVQSLSLRYIILTLKRKELDSLLRKIRNLWDWIRVEEIATVQPFVKKVYYYRIFFMWNAIAVVTVFMVTAHFVRLPPNVVNGTERRVLPFGFYVDVQEEPTYTIVYLIQGLACYNVAIILTGIEITAPYLIMMTCGYLRSIRYRLLAMEKAAETNANDSLSSEEVSECAEFHQRILHFCSEIEHFTRSLFMTAIICSAYNISLILIKLTANDDSKFKFITLMSMNSMQLFVAQWGPEHLINESVAIADAAYSATLTHSQYNKKANVILQLIIMRAQKPVQLTAGGYINLSMETYGHMITNAFSFFTVARSFQE